MTVKQHTVTEINRILPMVRETIRKERRINSLREKLKQHSEDVNKEYKKIVQGSNSLASLADKISRKELPNEAEMQLFNTVKNNIEEFKSGAEIVISKAKEISELAEQCKFEQILYSVITYSVSMGSLLEEDDIQNNFLQEYVYLLMNNVLTMDNLFEKEAHEPFYNAIKFDNGVISSLNIPVEELIEMLRAGKEEDFFTIFK